MNFQDQTPDRASIADNDTAPRSTLRLGVDVGGTFTKAVALRLTAHESPQIVAQAITPTTHHDLAGVARGIIDALSVLLTQLAADPAYDAAHITSVAHSTTQAVNALLEGDVTPVGIIGIGLGRDPRIIRRRVTPGNIQLAPGKQLNTYTEWLTHPVTPEAATGALSRLTERGAGVFVASGLYAVDEPSDELTVMAAARQAGLTVIGGHQVSGMYGLEVRTTTAAINASIIPKMTHTADQVERALHEAGIAAPLLIMRGDGGVTDSGALRSRPILSLLSGPAASVAGALLFGRVLDGVFIEVGGTSTNLALIQDGQPRLRYVQIMDHPTCVRSLDVRVQGVAGGSMARLSDEARVIDVGPRSAHIAGLPYLCFSQPRGVLSLDLFAPLPGDPADYACVVDESGTRFALTVTCAANALGRVPADAYAHASREIALRGFGVLGEPRGLSPEQVARQLLDLAARKIAGAATRLIRDYKVRLHKVTLIGGGGGAGALVPSLAAMLEAPYEITTHAEVISSIGVALALVREEVERGLGTVTADALAREATDRAIQAGALPETIQVSTETIPERGTLRATATGSHALIGDSLNNQPLTPDELRSIVALRVEVSVNCVMILTTISGFHIIGVESRSILHRWRGVVVVSAAGGVRYVGRGARVIAHRPHPTTSPLQTQTGENQTPDFPSPLAERGRGGEVNWAGGEVIRSSADLTYTLITPGRLLQFGADDVNSTLESLQNTVQPFALIAERVEFW